MWHFLATSCCCSAITLPLCGVVMSFGFIDLLRSCGTNSPCAPPSAVMGGGHVVVPPLCSSSPLKSREIIPPYALPCTSLSVPWLPSLGRVVFSHRRNSLEFALLRALIKLTMNVTEEGWDTRGLETENFQERVRVMEN